jgi:hypothetical protein
LVITARAKTGKNILMTYRLFFILIFLAGLRPAALADDWPTVNHDMRHRGATMDSPLPPYRVRWIRQFPNELMTTRVEAIVASGRVFVGTYAGRLHALDAETGEEKWTAQLDGPILHSVAVAEGRVFAGTAGGSIYALNAADGKPLWRFQAGDHGFDTAPLVTDGKVIMGSRGWTLYAIDAATGKRRWRLPVGAPIRTTAAGDGKAVYFAAEDMRARACDLKTGKLLWTSAPLQGQSLRDYYPVLIGGNLILRSNPVGPFADRLAEDRNVLRRNAGIDDSDWRSVDAFLKSDRTDGTPLQIAQEQFAIQAHLRFEPDARTFFLLDCHTGEETVMASVLYAAGCQGVGIPPVMAPDGRPIVFWRSAYSNWNLGVAPLVSVGYLNFTLGGVEPIRHASGAQPPWNTFWGTADETTRLTVGGNILYFSHQDTLAGMDLTTKTLFPIAGNRDTWGGYRNLPWARNEWHGPARGAVAISGDTLYWISGSRVIAVQGGIAPFGNPPEPFPPLPPAPQVEGAEGPMPDPYQLEAYVWQDAAPAFKADSNPKSKIQNLKFPAAVSAALSGPWKPLYVQPGLAGREFFFAHSSETFEALALSYPLLDSSLKARVKEYLAKQWELYPPYSQQGAYPLNAGKPRERFAVPDELRTQAGSQNAPPAIAYLYPVWRYAAELDEWERVSAAWPELQQVFEDFRASDWKLDPLKGDLWANRIVGGLIGYARLAKHFDDPTAEDAAHLAEDGLYALLAWMRQYEPAQVERALSGVDELDQIIGGGDALFMAAQPHKGRLARLYGMTSEIAACLRDHAGPHLRALMGTMDRMMPGWYLMGEERQVHFGENFEDYPDQALAIFTARLCAAIEPPEKMRRYLDMPLCPADLYDIEKRALWLRAGASPSLPAKQANSQVYAE